MKSFDKICLIAIYIISWNEIIHTNAQKCDVRRVKILNNVYTMSVIKKFQKKIPTAVFYPKRNDIEYIIESDNAFYHYDIKTKTDKVLQETRPKTNDALLINSYIGITINSIVNKKIATLNATSDDRIIFKKHDSLVLVIKYPFDDANSKFGKMYAFNETNFAIIGQFVITEFIEEVGDNVVDIAISPVNGNIVVAVKDSNEDGALILLKKQNKDPCPDEDCYKENVISGFDNILDDVKDNIESVIKKSLSKVNPASNIDIENYKQEIFSLKTYNQQLELSLEAIQQLFDEFKEEVIDSSISENNPIVPMRSKRNVRKNLLMCTPKLTFAKQKKAVNEALSIVSKMNVVIDGLENDLNREIDAPQIDPRILPTNRTIYRNTPTNRTSSDLRYI